MKRFIGLRTLVATAGAIAAALTNVLLRREPARIELRPGDAAPDFRLVGSDGRTYTLSEFRGRQAVVLAWFPKAFTGGCTAECRSIGASGGALRPFRVAYFGASVDSVETNRRFAASMDIDFPILSDPGRTTARAYGVIGATGFPARWTFYIGLDGRIVAIDKQVRTSTHGTDIAARLAELAIPRQA